MSKTLEDKISETEDDLQKEKNKAIRYVTSTPDYLLKNE